MKTTIRAGVRLAMFLGMAALAGAMTAAPAAAQPACGSAVTVAPGDTLGRIASRCGTTVSALLQVNPQIDDPSNIFVGQVIRMPGASAGQPSGPSFGRPGPPPPAFEPPATEGTYRVRPGDTLAAIAGRFGVPLAQLISANPDVDPRFLRPGLVLRIPGDERPPDFEPPQREAALFVEPAFFARPGSDVELSARGLPPGSFARILGGSDPGDLTVLDRARVDGRGRLFAEVEVPDWARPGRSFYFAVETRRPRALAMAEPIRVGWGGRGRGRGRGLTVIGTVTREGVECPAVRGDDGRLYTLAGEVRGLRPGDRVRVEGRPAEVSFCQQGTTIEVSRIRPVD